MDQAEQQIADFPIQFLVVGWVGKPNYSTAALRRTCRGLVDKLADGLVLRIAYP